jgi:hypothetical protein
MIKIEEAIKFIRERGGLTHWTDDEIKMGISKSIQNYAFTYTRNEKGELDGLAFGQWITSEKLHISYMTGKLNVFMDYLRNTFPKCKYITAFRKGKTDLITIPV